MRAEGAEQKVRHRVEEEEKKGGLVLEAGAEVALGHEELVGEDGNGLGASLECWNPVPSF